MNTPWFDQPIRRVYLYLSLLAVALSTGYVVGCATLKAAEPMVVQTLEQIANAYCVQAETADPSPGDVLVDTYCKDPAVIDAIVSTLLAAKPEIRARIAKVRRTDTGDQTPSGEVTPVSAAPAPAAPPAAPAAPAPAPTPAAAAAQP
jgi:hypothetical protein